LLSSAAGHRGWLAVSLLVLALGLALEVVCWARQSLLVDQLILLRIGADYVASGALPPVAKPRSGDGMIPGGLLGLVTGLPLRVWPDYRAPGLLFLFSRLLAVLLVSATLHRALGARLSMLFLLITWLSPWHISHAGFLWEPNLLMLPSALHLAACYALREERRFFPSAVIGVTIVLAFQIHASALILFLAAAVLIWRRLVHVDWRGIFAGALAGSSTLIATAAAFLGGDLPNVLPHRGSAEAPDLLLPAANVLKGFSYWLRLGTPDVGRRLRDTLYLGGGLDGEAPWFPLPRPVVMAVAVGAFLSIAFSAAASWRAWWREARARGARGADACDRSPAGWLRRYALSFFLASLLACAVSPVTMQSWHLLIALFAACLPVTFLLGEWLASPARSRRIVALAFMALHLSVSVLIAAGSPMFMRRILVGVEDPSFPSQLKPYVVAIAGSGRVAAHDAPPPED
jgi:hypothetical protein